MVILDFCRGHFFRFSPKLKIWPVKISLISPAFDFFAEQNKAVVCYHLKPIASSCRSRIEGRGLFCKRQIDTAEMVIEYAGSVIRGTLTDKREKYYDEKVDRLILFSISHFA